MSQTTRTKIYPSDAVPRIDHLHQPGGAPFRAYETLVDRIKAAITDEAEERTCVIVHTEHGPEAWYEHTLSPLEAAQRALEAQATALSQIRGRLPREGEAMTAEDVAQLRALLG